MLRIPLRRLSTADPAASLTEYKKAVEHVRAKEYKAAEDEFHRCLKALDVQGLHADSSYNFVLTRIAAMQRALFRYQDCEVTLERVARNFQTRAKQYPEQLSRAYTNLMMQYLQTNVVKGVKVGAALQQEPYWSEITRQAQKDIHFLFGTALLLHGKDLSSAKQQLKTCLQKSPGPNSCFVLHNLACAQWWHAGQLTGEEHPEARAISLEFTECLPNFRLALNLFEGREGQYSLSDTNEFKNPLTGLTLTNIAEMTLEGGDLQEGHKWLKKTFDFYEKVAPKDIGRTLMLMSALMSHRGEEQEALAVGKSAVDILHGRNDFAQVAALEHYARLLEKDEKRKVEAEAVKAEAKTLSQKLPFWMTRAMYLHIPVWEVV